MLEQIRRYNQLLKPTAGMFGGFHQSHRRGCLALRWQREREEDRMRKLWLILSFIFLSSNVHAFDFCSELKKAIETCCSEVQAVDPNFDVYLSHCDVKDSVYDTVDNVFRPIGEKRQKTVQVKTLGNTILRFKFSKCLRAHQFEINFE
jgi:hypothetical protein